MRIFPRPVQRVDYILELCQDKKVLHLGCTDWPYTDFALRNQTLLHPKLLKRAADLYGLDADEEGLSFLRSKGFANLYHGNLESLDFCEIDDTFEVVIAGEMIEHLSNPGMFLAGIQRFLKPESRLVITTVNAYCAMRMLIYGLRGRGGTAEPVHPDHVAYYSFSTLKLLLQRHGLRVSEFLFYDIGREHRPFNRRVWNMANDAAVRLFPQLSDGIIAVCSLDDGHTSAPSVEVAA